VPPSGVVDEAAVASACSRLCAHARARARACVVVGHQHRLQRTALGCLPLVSFVMLASFRDELHIIRPDLSRLNSFLTSNYHVAPLPPTARHQKDRVLRRAECKRSMQTNCSEAPLGGLQLPQSTRSQPLFSSRGHPRSQWSGTPHRMREPHRVPDRRRRKSAVSAADVAVLAPECRRNDAFSLRNYRGVSSHRFLCKPLDFRSFRRNQSFRFANAGSRKKNKMGSPNPNLAASIYVARSEHVEISYAKCRLKSRL
jgi:hypothetical protein